MAPESADPACLAIDALTERLRVERNRTAVLVRAGESLDRRMMAARLVAFAAFAGALGTAVVTRNEWFAARLTWPPLVLFILLVFVHAGLRRRHQRVRTRLTLVDAKLGRITEPLAGVGNHRSSVPEWLRSVDEDGAEATPEWVNDDLAIFGDGRSLFSLLDTTRTVLGRSVLIDRLERPSLRAATIEGRREVVQWLLSRPALRDALALEFALVAGLPRSHSLEFLSRSSGLGAAPRLSIVAGGLVVLSLGLWTSSLVFSSGTLALFALALTGFLNLRFASAMRSVVESRNETLRLEPLLRAVRAVDSLLAGAPQPPARARSACDALHHAVAGAEAPIPRLLRALRTLSIFRAGMLYVAFNALTLWELWFGTPLLRAWHAEQRRILDAFRALGDLEFLTALTDFTEEHRGLSWPTVSVEASPRLELAAMRHPLLDPRQSVPNDLDLGHGPRIALVTGSNMSGKSTFLRATALNVVLAQIGAPVCAALARLTPLRVLSAINVRDALDSGESFFAVEVERIRHMLDVAASGVHCLLVIDEAFRGTNSLEKAAATGAVARYLSGRPALALIATHDLELSVLEAECDGIVRNWHFSDDVVGHTMVFDYRMKPGPAAATNAIRLLEARGFPQEVVAEARRRACHG